MSMLDEAKIAYVKSGEPAGIGVPMSRSQVIARAQVAATLAVAEELAALREHGLDVVTGHDR